MTDARPTVHLYLFFVLRNSLGIYLKVLVVGNYPPVAPSAY